MVALPHLDLAKDLPSVFTRAHVLEVVAPAVLEREDVPVVATVGALRGPQPGRRVGLDVGDAWYVQDFADLAPQQHGV